MNNAAAIVLGVLIGWLIEWIIDWFYWRRRIDDVASENRDLKTRITTLEEETQRLEEPSRKGPLRDAKGHDNLQAIYGVGPVFARRLNDAGIRTFEQLAQLTTKDLEEILGTLFKRFFAKENSILAQAKEFAEQKR